ncbi:Trk system potassium transporter TrkA [Natranaerobius trueperi]|uniref:Trk system potassium uptake protein TrkA n=1 Tax=Natranaerobius trueperi TaxID=759412 RepID=A0A226C1P7_9FIRM|nr:Trk system potassium transporter TrkA [Natranaerobius trueperi]OWZ84359.1 Trk system potassium transport protein TrkA [Natranaerobius trueperi]
MYVVIIGGSEVGRVFAERLIKKKQKVVIIEKDKEKAQKLKEKLDILVIEGNGTNLEDLKKAKIKEAEMIISVTGDDAVNLLSCMIAKNLGVYVTVARLFNPESVGTSDTRGLSKKDVGIDYIINPQKAMAQEIVELIHFPHATDIEFFADGKVAMLGLFASQEGELVNKKLEECSLPEGCNLIGIKKQGDHFKIPSDNNQISSDNIVYLVGDIEAIKDANWQISHKELNNKRILILGGKITGYNLAKNLESRKDHNFMIKIIEKDSNRSEFLKRNLKSSIVLEGEYFNEEEIAEADVVVTVTGDDKTNIIASIMAKSNGVDTISEIVDVNYESIFDSVGIESTVNPHLTTASQIMRFTREQDIVSLTILRHGEGIATELLLPESAPVVGKKISEINLPKDIQIGVIVRDGEIFIPEDKSTLKTNDKLVIFTPPNKTKLFNKYFHNNA